MATTLRARQGDTLDELLWREMGLGPADLPAVLDANPGIATDVQLAIGAIVTVPAAQNSPATPTRDLVNLWD